jgi:Ca-activated chloride channel family protein
MPVPLYLQLPLALAAGVILLVLLAERLHERRCRVAARLATGPTGRPRRWVRAVRGVKAVALGAMAWSLLTLWFSSGGGYGDGKSPTERREHRQHIAFVADLSPSMQLRDAGPGRDLTRTQRMHEVVQGILQRIDGDVIYSVVGFYTDARPVIVDAEDAELVRNVFNGLPIWFAMKPGKTDLGTAVRKALEHLADYPKDSTTVFICTDGDTVELGTLPKPPPAAREVYVLGVGDQRQGSFIDGHMSRQDPVVLRTLAGRLHGQYLDVNEKHVPTLTLGALAASAGATKGRFDLTDLAIIVFAAAAAAHAFIPVLLEYLGSDWKAVRVNRPELAEGRA